MKFWKKLELSLTVGLLVGLLTAPVSVRETALSRWTVEEPAAMRYQVCFFPFSVGRVEEPCAAVETEQEGSDYELDFWVLRWWREAFPGNG